MLTDDEIKAMAYKAADGEAGKRNFNADMSWVIAFTRAVEAAQRERCIATLHALRDRSGVNDTGTAWLVRLTRGDCVTAIAALGPNVPHQPDP